jgi:DNA-binding NtrC family response regulator
MSAEPEFSNELRPIGQVTTAVHDGRTSGPRASLWLTVVDGSKPRVVALEEDRALHIGRAPDGDIVLSGSFVSRRHATLSVSAGCVTVKDEGSTNGTRVGRTRVPRLGVMPVPMGTPIFIGAASLVIHKLPATPSSCGLMEAAKTWLASEHLTSVRSAADAVIAPRIVMDATMRDLYHMVDRVGAGMISVLLTGETGVGKEIVANAIHERSPRCKHPMVRINCAALSESLLESELFGHAAGAFTSARGAKEGLLETANHSTVFLDEVGEMPLSIQAKLLRVIESREVTRLGETRPRRLDVRFVSATNRDLGARAREGGFREDLYFRLNGVQLHIPPLRERRTEIASLACQFAREAARSLGRPGADVHFTSEALKFMEDQNWPGNIRELRNCVDRAILLADGPLIDVGHLTRNNPVWNRAPIASVATNPRDAVSLLRDGQDEKARIEAALQACSGNQTRAAEALGIPRRTLVRRLVELGIQRPRANRQLSR